jgi:hypothetical protein
MCGGASKARRNVKGRNNSMALNGYERLMKKKLTLPADHPDREEFPKTDQTFKSYLKILGRFMDAMPMR